MKYMKPIVLVDMDNVLNAFSEHFEYTLLEKGIKLDHELLNDDYDLTKTITNKNAKERKQIMMDVFNTESFWQTLPVQKNSFDVLKKLSFDYTLEIATKLPDNKANSMIKKAKLEWLDANFPTINFNRVHFTAEKFKLQGDYMIDDYAPNWNNTFAGKSVKYWYKYNDTDESDFTVHSWKEAEKLFDMLKKGLI